MKQKFWQASLRAMSIAAILALGLLASCGNQVPSADQFHVPAVGTPLPGEHEEAVKVDLAPDQSGVLFRNYTASMLPVAVNNTITTISPGQDFLFILPPGTHQFYVYEPNAPPRIHVEKLDGGKLRYVYWYSQVSRPGG